MTRAPDESGDGEFGTEKTRVSNGLAGTLRVETGTAGMVYHYAHADELEEGVKACTEP